MESPEEPMGPSLACVHVEDPGVPTERDDSQDIAHRGTTSSSSVYGSSLPLVSSTIESSSENLVPRQRQTMRQRRPPPMVSSYAATTTTTSLSPSYSRLGTTDHTPTLSATSNSSMAGDSSSSTTSSHTTSSSPTPRTEPWHPSPGGRVRHWMLPSSSTPRRPQRLPIIPARQRTHSESDVPQERAIPGLRPRAATESADAWAQLDVEEPPTPPRTNPLPREPLTRLSRQEDPSAGVPVPHAAQERAARRRWMRINHRFQLVIAAVALVFSLLIFAILVCWVVWAFLYLFSRQLPCDLPLGAYFWLATIQLFVDVFRADILRICFGWDPNTSEHLPCSVVVYNVCYLVYAAMVLRLGIMSVYMDTEEGSTCRITSPRLFQASAAFVSLSIAAWATIVLGYLIPMLIAAAMLTHNGYNPSAQPVGGGGTAGASAPQAVLPSVYAASGAPANCIERLPTIGWSELEETLAPRDRDCCICMETFAPEDCIVKTACDHIFHKSCCKEWLRQARTCPVCRMDIPASLNVPAGATSPSTSPSDGPTGQARIPFGPTGRPVAGVMRMFSRSENDTASQSGEGSGALQRAPSVTLSSSALEEDRV